MRKAIMAALAAAMLCGCMSDREYQLRKRQLEAQAAHPPTYELFTVSGPFKMELAENGTAKVAVPNQPFQAIPIPDGARTQLEAAKFIGGVAAGTALGWKALGNAKGDVTNNTTNNYAGGAE